MPSVNNLVSKHSKVEFGLINSDSEIDIITKRAVIYQMLCKIVDIVANYCQKITWMNKG
jgi:hypothetical protein